MSAAVSPFKLYPHQEDAVEAIVAALQTDDRTQAIMACGTGKTFTGQRAAERITKDNPDALTLVTVPNMVLVDQLMREWIAQVTPGLEFRAQPVVSEAASTATRAAAAKRDEIVGFELRDNTTDPQRLAAFMLASGRRIIFSTYQSSDRIAEAVAIAKKSRPAFSIDLIVADEAHRTAGPGTKAEAGLFKTILDDTNVKAAKRLFMTATPRQSRVPKGEKDNAAFSMGNEQVYGKRATTLSLSWAVENGHLAPYRAFIAQVSDTDVEEILLADDRLRVRGHKAVITARATQVAAAIVLVKAAKQRNLGSIVTYHNSIQRAEDFKVILNHVVAAMPADSKPSGKLSVKHINGLTSAEDRAAYLATLDSENRKPGDWSVITNCNCLTEGVNVPSMDAIMLVDPRSSNVGIVQAIGRPMRKDKNRPDKVASILLPVFVGQYEAAEEAIEAGVFTGVYEALQALKDVDDALSDMFIAELAKRELETDEKPRSTDLSQIHIEPPGDRTFPNIDEDPLKQSGAVPLTRIADHNGTSLPGQAVDAVVTIMAAASDGAASSRRMGTHLEWHKAINLRVLEDNADWWERGLAALRRFVKVHGHASVPYAFKENEHLQLGKWVSSRRSEKRRGVLSFQRQEALQSLPGWEWDPQQDERDALYAVKFAALRAHVAEFGHGRVHQHYISADGHALGVWVSNKRMDFKEGRMTPESLADFESIPGWLWDPKEADRQYAMDSLRRYAAENGHCRVPVHCVTSDGFLLGKWVAQRRENFKKGKLSAEHTAELESLDGWVWSVQEAARRAMLSLLASFVKHHGHASVPFHHVSDTGAPLGTWISSRRVELRKGTLSTEYIADLDAIDETWRRGAVAPWESEQRISKAEQSLAA